MAENVKVIVRSRPMNQKEKDLKCKNIVKIQDCMVELENANDPTLPPKSFTYDSAYSAETPTEAVYNDICYSLVENVIEGYNGTIFAYGQTGCGKSHTMQGPEITKNSNQHLLAQRGIISRSFDHIFEAISVISGYRYLALVSYLEIYNENIRDLLCPNTSSSTLVLKEQPGEGVIVQNLSTHAVHNAQDCEKLLAIGTKNRIVGATLMNAASSRSHSIFTISLEQISTTSKLEENESPSLKKGKLNLVDLAGSERQNKTGATGERLKEATKINLSLSALGNVISALVDGKTKHIPYRDSKLTRLLQDSLGGNTKTLMIACISPAAFNYDETLSTLRYASRAKNIHNKPKINEDPKDAMLREYQEEIVKLRQMLNNSHGSNTENGNIIQNDSWLEEEKRKLKEMYEQDAQNLRSTYEAQQREKDHLMNDIEKLKVHYENQLKELSTTQAANAKIKIKMEAEAISKIKSDLIGGERANDTQLKEKRKKKKQAAERKLRSLMDALNRVEQSEDRDLLQEHYSDIEQELLAKTDTLKKQRQTVRALEREVTDLQSEFQLDRADYLETIRRLEKNLRFYQQLLDKALPLLRKDGRFWDVDTIKADSEWNDDLRKWKISEDTNIRLKLPPAEPHVKPLRKDLILNGDVNGSIFNGTGTFPSSAPVGKILHNGVSHVDERTSSDKDITRRDGKDIAVSYFRPRRAAELIQQNQVINDCREFFADYTPRMKSNGQLWATPSHQKPLTIQWPIQSPPIAAQIPISQTWCGPSAHTSLEKAIENLTNGNDSKLPVDNRADNHLELSPESTRVKSRRPQAATARLNRMLLH